MPLQHHCFYWSSSELKSLELLKLLDLLWLLLLLLHQLLHLLLFPPHHPLPLSPLPTLGLVWREAGGRLICGDTDLPPPAPACQALDREGGGTHIAPPHLSAPDFTPAHAPAPVSDPAPASAPAPLYDSDPASASATAPALAVYGH